MSNETDLRYARTQLAVRLTALFKRPETPVDAVAQAIGHPDARFLTAVAKGKHRLPLDLVPALSRALDVDALHLLALAIRPYSEALGDCLDSYRDDAASQGMTTRIEIE